MWITSMGNHGAAGVYQNAGILVVLVLNEAFIFIEEDAFENISCITLAILFMPQCDKWVNQNDRVTLLLFQPAYPCDLQ